MTSALHLTNTDRAIEQALLQIDSLCVRFPMTFPGDTTVKQFYQDRKLGHYPAGANVGWTSGFWPGMLWNAYMLSGKQRYQHAAEALLPSFAERINARVDLEHHDLGFLYGPSCITAFRLTGNQAACASALAAADCLMGRYLPVAGILQAWGDLNDPLQQGRIIIDCLMNLPLLHWAGTLTGEQRYQEAARSHLCLSRDYLIRPDDSSYHTYHFDPKTGVPIRGSTAQGNADNSCWSRGQAWGIYGFALNHRYAPDLNLLPVAMKMADYFLEHLPSNGVACWDLSFSHDSGEPSDSSASAIAVCGLLELVDLLPPSPKRTQYSEAAYRILDGLITDCMARLPNSDGLLAHGVYSKPGGNGIDEANLWGDFFYLEALARVTGRWKTCW